MLARSRGNLRPRIEFTLMTSMGMVLADAISTMAEPMGAA
jgi:hypothetical protein